VSTLEANQAQPGRQGGSQAALQDALKRAASVLKARDLVFSVTGSFALWVHGAPEPTHDVDLAVAEQDTEAAADALADAGFTIERPPEDWLFKARAEGADIDVLHRLNGTPLDREALADAELLDVLGVRMPVMPARTVVVAKLRSLSEHYCDFAALLPAVRAVREQVSWDEVRAQTADNDFAVAFLVLADRLGITR
jgi:Nucleotidyl transferase of unknown function (DUF2204)